VFGGHGRIIEVRNIETYIFFHHGSNPYLLTAYRASQYLEKLIDQGAIVPEASEDLNKLYAEHDPSQSNEAAASSSDTHSTNPHSSPDSTANPEPAPPPLLLTRAAIPAIVSLFNLTGHSSADMYRALEQARLRNAGVRSTRK